MVSSCSSQNLGLGFSLLEKKKFEICDPGTTWLGELGCAHHSFSILLLLFSSLHLFPRVIPREELLWEAGDGFGMLDNGSFPISLEFPRTKSLLSPWWV